MKKSITPSFIAGLALLMMPALAVAQTTSQETEPNIHMPSFYELEEGWNTMKPGGATRCAHGTEYEFYTRAADPEKLLVFLYGGGACWDAEGCREGSNIYSFEINSESHASRLGGILDPDHPENPFGEFSMVAIPVCTGDVHIGQRLSSVSAFYSNTEYRTKRISHGFDGDFGYLVQHEYFHRPGEPEPYQQYRVTMLFRIESGEWKLFHRHADSQVVFQARD